MSEEVFVVGMASVIKCDWRHPNVSGFVFSCAATFFFVQNAVKQAASMLSFLPDAKSTFN